MIIKFNVWLLWKYKNFISQLFPSHGSLHLFYLSVTFIIREKFIEDGYGYHHISLKCIIYCMAYVLLRNSYLPYSFDNNT